MAIKVSLNHITNYKYNKHIQLGPQIVRLRPAPHSRTPVLSYSLKIKPKNHFINWQQDPQGNYLARIVFPEKTNCLRIEVDLIADMTIINPFDFFLEESAEHFPFTYESWLKKELKPFLEKEKQKNIFNEYLDLIPREEKPIIDFLVYLNQKISQDIKYLIRLEPGVQNPEETLKKSSGSCRDSAWLLVQILRHLGLASRFVSGYLIQLKADVQSLDGPSGTDHDFTDLHAWAEIYLPGAGWIGMDPTSGLLTGEGHIPLVATPDPTSAAPITGAIEKCETDFEHTMKIDRIYEDPRVTKPYTKDQWAEIDALGHLVDENLIKSDVRLTMGGEPTFVSIDKVDSPEWNTDALGAEKRKLSLKLFEKLKLHWSQNSLVFHGQGKWYPGEPLPRWILGCYWRKDEKPIWKNQFLLGNERNQYAYTEKDAQRFLKLLISKLNIDSECIIPGYEDLWYLLWKEKKLPINVDPLNSKLDDVLERKRLATIFQKKLGNVVGYVLPLLREKNSWISSIWEFNAGSLFLIPGDSPMGLRLPLDSLPWAKSEDQHQIIERDPLDPLKEFKDHLLESNLPLLTMKRKKSQPNNPENESAKNVVRTALCVEIRNGKFYVFLPPVSTFDDYLNLIQYIESTAEELKISLFIEGYPPPFDTRVNSFSITPDPGVIEVNVAPVSNWKQLVKQTTTLYDSAHVSRLGTEKFMLDGKHTGTGGGNHIVLGGITPADSPFLRRPDLLASMISYWNNHPSLSYLFSGMFIGPTSQAPRVDEGKRESVYELEIAMQQVKKEIDKYGKCPPWMVDRLFRHLLVDGTGNTHRAEFCIDKLYSPDSATGRLGLVELRGFEMTPHAQMNLMQQLLIRALVCKFWDKPFVEKLIRWDKVLHDQFLLPYFVKKDFKEIILDLNQFGFSFKMEYFDPHFEFRFPLIGTIEHDGILVEIRTAIEPWYVLGEEPSGGGTSRFVDSSVEKLQIKVIGMNDRYIICCNQRKIPLRHVESQGEYVAGIRYRAWQPASCLHPTIPVHTPLVFDIIDQWSKRSIGGCTYHVAHPGGRNYDTFPVNAYEAESRRAARFFKMGHTPGKIERIPRDATNPDFPLTLDLRWMSHENL